MRDGNDGYLYFLNEDIIIDITDEYQNGFGVWTKTQNAGLCSIAVPHIEYRRKKPPQEQPMYTSNAGKSTKTITVTPTRYIDMIQRDAQEIIEACAKLDADKFALHLAVQFDINAVDADRIREIIRMVRAEVRS